MIKTRLIRLLKGSGKYVVMQVIWQWLSLLAQIMIVADIAGLVDLAWNHSLTKSAVIYAAMNVTAGVLARFVFDHLYTSASFHASADVKRVLRDRIYEKMLRLGPSYREQISTASIVQMAGEGVEQLETYFGRYLSQFFYALLAPLTLFIFIARIHLHTALVLLIAVPLIPIVIMLVMIVAKRLLSSYFDIYYGLGDSFLEKLQGMTTLKIYQADQAAADDMDKESEKFRKITMKVLMMQLNSTAIMDIIAYGGAAIGIITGLVSYAKGSIPLSGMVMIILLAAEFFLPMRVLGSFFHIGMNGMKASDRIFAFLDLPEPEQGDKAVDPDDGGIGLKNVSFAYEEGRDVLSDVSLDIAPHSFVSLVGVSGSGKSTIAGILMKQNRGYRGDVSVNHIPLDQISNDSLLQHITMVGSHSWLFAGTVKDNLLMGNPHASEKEMLDALKEVNLFDFVSSKQGLHTPVLSNGANQSGGQRQRLALARALLKDTPVYLFDEATSNIDAESEAMIMDVIHHLAKAKTVILITHRLANVEGSSCIYMLENGKIKESGTKQELLELNGSFARLYQEQKELENFAAGKEALA